MASRDWRRQPAPSVAADLMTRRSNEEGPHETLERSLHVADVDTGTGGAAQITPGATAANAAEGRADARERVRPLDPIRTDEKTNRRTVQPAPPEAPATTSCWSTG